MWGHSWGWQRDQKRCSKGERELNQLNVRIAKSCFPLRCYSTYAIAPWVSVSSTPDDSWSRCPCPGTRRQQRIASGPQSGGAAPAAGSGPRHRAGCVRLGPRPPPRPPRGPLQRAPSSASATRAPMIWLDLHATLGKHRASGLLPSGGCR